MLIISDCYVFRVWISELERSRITVEEIKPLLHDEVRFQNANCTISFNNSDDDDDDGETSNHLSEQKPTEGRTIIRTSDMSPGEIFSSIMDKYNPKPIGYL